MRPAVVLAAGAAAAAVLVVALMLPESPRRAGSNYVPELGPVLELEGADSHCEEVGLVPADTGALRLLVGTHYRPTPRIEVTLTDAAGRTMSAGRLPAGRGQGHVIVPIERLEETVRDVRVCVSTGPGGRTVFYGETPKVSLAWLRPGSESLFELLPTIAHRFGLGKANPIGSWLLALAALFLAGAWLIALRLASRELGR